MIERAITEGIAKKHREGTKRIDVPPVDITRRFLRPPRLR
jgi:hypothetical protein